VFETSCTTVMEHLNLDSNGISCEGAVAIAKALETNQTLQHLNLQHNGIGCDGAAAISKALELNEVLQQKGVVLYDLPELDDYHESEDFLNWMTIMNLRKTTESDE